MASNRLYRSASNLLVLAIVAHLPLIALDFASYGVNSLTSMVVFALMAIGLRAGRRLAAYAGFVGALAGVSIAFGGTIGAGASANPAIIQPLFFIISGLYTGAASVLFAILWRGKATE